MRLAVEVRFAPSSENELLAVGHALPIVDHDDGETWHESFATNAWLAGGRGARITHGHDGPTVGHVVVAVARGLWHIADAVIESDDPLILRHVRTGRPVSLDARSIKRDDNELTHVRRHRLAQLQAIAIVNDGEVPVYADAGITSVRELAACTATNGRPSVRETLGGYVFHEGDELIDHEHGTVHRYDGRKLVRV
jgi:hypothetical protein